MGTGTVIYWNGDSGWIKQSGVENLITALANDVIFTLDTIVAGVPKVGAVASFDLIQNGVAYGVDFVSSPSSGPNPPVLTSISPTVTNTGSQKISARGSNFTLTSVMVFNGVVQITTFQDSKWLEAIVVSPGVGFYDVLVRDTGGDSISFQFEFK